jgi:subtilisin family serine protease
MKTKPTLIALAVSAAFTGSVQAQWIADAGKYEGWQDAKLKHTGVLNAWNRNITGAGVRIAILDSGFDLSHPDLVGQVIAAKNFNNVVTANTKSNTNNFRINIQPGTDITWSLHGTQMASIAAGLDNNLGTVGVAPGAKLLLAQVAQGVVYSKGNWTYSGNGISTPGINQALAWAEQNGATVANLSLGSTYDNTFQKGVVHLGNGVYRAPANYGSMYGNRQSDLMNFVNASKNIVITAAAGNSGLPYAQFPGAYATQVDANGRLLLGGRVLIVGSVTENIDSKGRLIDAANPWRMSSFSNRAGSFCTNLSGSICKDPYYVKDFFVVAPGESVVGAIPTQLKQTNLANPGSGTSQASAYVAGGVALIKQAWPQLSAAQIVDLVKTTATDLGAKGVDEVFGHGMVNFDKATQPTGTLQMAKDATIGVVGNGVPIADVGIVLLTGNGITTSSVLQNSMAVDNIGRHYSVNLTKATAINRAQTYQYGSAWLALSPNNYREVMLPVGNEYAVKMMQTDTGMASQVDYYHGNMTYSVQVGGMTERNGFLGNQGFGPLAFGNSSTSYAQLGIGRQFDNTLMFAHYGLAVTQTGSVSGSMVQFNGNIASQTWKLGMAQNNVIFKDTVRDQVSLSVVNPVTVRRGSATITGVTDYKFTELADGSVSASPVVTSETVSLRPAARPFDLVLGYAVMDRQGSRLSVNLARQFNVAGQAGETATGAGLMFNKLF